GKKNSAQDRNIKPPGLEMIECTSDSSKILMNEEFVKESAMRSHVLGDKPGSGYYGNNQYT
ncbi:hypothetical protein ABTG69_20105, partial [Acinetobacter baumannii]